VLVTNSHVVSGQREVLEGGRHSPLRLDQAAAHLDVLKKPLQCRGILWESTPENEDTTVIALDNASDIVSDRYPVFARPLPVGGTGRIFIIGYPEGSTQIRMSFENNQLLEMNDRHLRYRTPTEEGSSGSPLFDGEWQLVGIHHYSSQALDSFLTPGKKLAANQGVWIRRIQRAIEQGKSKVKS
jgi:trypsin-like peptidase